MWWAATVTWAAVLTHPERRIGGQEILSSGSRSCAGTLSSWGPGNPNEGQDVRGEVHNPQQAPPPNWKVDVPEQYTAASSAYEVHGASETHSGPAHKPPEPGTHRMRDDKILQTLKKPSWRLKSCGWQLKSRHRSKRCPWWVSSAGMEWREELVQALEQVAVVMKDKLASLP